MEGFPSTDRGKAAAEKREFEQKVKKEVERRMHALRLGGHTHDIYGDIAGAPTELAGQREKDTHTQRETRTTKWEPLRQLEVSYETEAWGNRGQFGQETWLWQREIQDNRIPELGGWEAGVRGPQIDLTGEDGYWQRKRDGNK